MLAKLPFHPMAKAFSLCERLSCLLQCTLVEIPKGIFYYTSCQPNWRLFLPILEILQPEVHLNVFLPSKIPEEHGLEPENIHMESPITCSILEKSTIFFNSSALVFFSMTCCLRFHVILVKQACPDRGVSTNPSMKICFVALGWLICSALFLLSLGDQYAFSRACVAPDEELLPPNLSKKVYYILFASNNLVVAVLYIAIIIRVKKVPTAPSICLVNTVETPISRLASIEKKTISGR